VSALNGSHSPAAYSYVHSAESAFINRMRRPGKRSPSVKRLILWAEDDTYLIQHASEMLADEGFEVIEAATGAEILKKVERHHAQIAAIVLDVMMKPGKVPGRSSYQSGVKTGYIIGRQIRQKYPNIPLIACSAIADANVEAWFKKYGHGFIRKPVAVGRVVELIKHVASGGGKPKPRCFIVHGHDHIALFELKDYLQNRLGFGEPLVLREQKSLGRTIIEKFEEAAEEVDLVFVLMTPDDKVAPVSSSNAVKRRARQNVIFETGYFFAKFQRRDGRVILLHKGKVELPTDIDGIIYIDISKGVERAGEDLRRELKDWLD
jgi:CheY-like chemotaxis protein